ncbi:hypothetical protein FACS1894202_08290 [Clostridia bacterium]|nr:hypothetical protein FACS1894202_08290 [Clostridia bacterium]
MEWIVRERIPACDNPTLVVGLYKHLQISDKPFARHFKGNIPEIAEYSQERYDFCPFANPSMKKNHRKKREPNDPVSMAVCAALRDNFDAAVSILEDCTGLYFSAKTCVTMLTHYKGCEGYRYYGATLYNIPWFLLYAEHALPLWGRYVRVGSPLHSTIKTNPDAVMLPTETNGYEQIKNAPNAEFSADFRFMDFRQRLTNGVLDESILFDVSDKGHHILQERIPIGLTDFSDYIAAHRGKPKSFRAKRQLAVAAEFFPEPQN